MISPNEIRQKAERMYDEFLLAYLEGKSFFPLILRSDKKPSDDFKIFQAELQILIEHSKVKKGIGYTIEFQEIATKKFGKQTLPSRIAFESENDYVGYLEKTREVAEFKQHVNRLITFPALTTWIRKNVRKVIKYSSSWNDLLNICEYFINDPKPNLYIRELPINVHTKFIEQHAAILDELLTQLIPEYINHNEREFEKRFHLKYNEPLIRVLILDESIAASSFSGIQDLSIKQSDFEKLSIPLEYIIILENKTNFTNIYNFLTLPHLKKTAAVFGKGFGVEVLKNAAWLNQVNILYWGDIDAQGFQILSQLRSYFPYAKSIMMDVATLKTFETECVAGTPTNVTKLANLTSEEAVLFDYVKDNNVRLEQEKIRHKYATMCFGLIFFEKK